MILKKKTNIIWFLPIGQIKESVVQHNTATLHIFFSLSLSDSHTLSLSSNTVTESLREKTKMGFFSFMGRVLFASLFILSAWQMSVLSLSLDPIFSKLLLLSFFRYILVFLHLGFHQIWVLDPTNLTCLLVMI